jgi:glutathione peroxidase
MMSGMTGITIPSASMSRRIVMKMNATAAGRPAVIDVGLEGKLMGAREDARKSNTLYDLSAISISGEHVALSRYAGDVLLIVNVASRCGYTPQYGELERLYRAHRDRGFTVLGFPCNQFGGQEPGDDREVASFCEATYDVTFPMFSKVDVNGGRAHPLFAYLKARRPGWLGTEAIKWNFTKFLVSRTGDVIARYGPTDRPDAIEPAVVAALDAN